MQNNKKLRKRNVTIVQDNTKIVQTSIKRAYLDDFTNEFRRYFYQVLQIVRIFAARNQK